MKTLLFTSLFLFSMFICPLADEKKDEKKSEETTVVICTGQYAKKYHKKKCRGLSNCKGEIKRVKLSEAKKNYTPCGICYK